MEEAVLVEIEGLFRIISYCLALSRTQKVGINKVIKSSICTCFILGSKHPTRNHRISVAVRFLPRPGMSVGIEQQKSVLGPSWGTQADQELEHQSTSYPQLLPNDFFCNGDEVPVSSTISWMFSSRGKKECRFTPRKWDEALFPEPLPCARRLLLQNFKSQQIPHFSISSKASLFLLFSRVNLT